MANNLKLGNVTLNCLRLHKGIPETLRWSIPLRIEMKQGRGRDARSNCERAPFGFISPYGSEVLLLALRLRNRPSHLTH
jgi:hypothetical protein